MRRVFQCGLPNGVFGDPLLVVRLRWERRSLLFDLGDLGRVATAELLKVSHAFVSHTHLDHFAGFDRLLRTRVGDPRPLAVVGPAGILDNVRGKLAGYTWNLVPAYPVALDVVEVDAEAVRRFAFPRGEGFEPRLVEERPMDGVVLKEPALEVRAAVVDHGTPCLAFAAREPRRINVRRERLDEAGLPTGRWLGDVKRAVLAGRGDEDPVDVPAGRDGPAGRRPLGWIRERFLLESDGETVAYVTDAAGHEENLDRIIGLVRRADRLFCEAMFAVADADRARAFHHLTTADAGRIAREADVAQLVPFHFSPRYEREPDRLTAEVRRVFAAVSAPPAWPAVANEAAEGSGADPGSV